MLGEFSSGPSKTSTKSAFGSTRTPRVRRPRWERRRRQVTPTTVKKRTSVELGEDQMDALADRGLRSREGGGDQFAATLSGHASGQGKRAPANARMPPAAKGL